ncbi:MAG: DUF4890 domain-containing protein [Phaeodactylibacter sp.]|nr:DUF4890 domain-containing protein [Phaeodactylibacter sp.]MCB9299376.1 DUF4890 domain-containing protein [Lewinellaceae bacterium]
MMIKIFGRILATAMVMMVLTLSVYAQRGGQNQTPEQRAEQQTERMKSNLGLDDKQAEQVKAINMKYLEKQKELKGDHDAMMKMNEEKNAELKQVLTEAQYQKQMELQKKRMEQKQGKQEMQKQGKKGKKDKSERKQKGKVSTDEG